MNEAGQLGWGLAAALFAVTATVTILSIRHSRVQPRSFQWPPPELGARSRTGNTTSTTRTRMTPPEQTEFDDEGDEV